MTKDTTTSASEAVTTCPRCGEPFELGGVRSLYSDELMCLPCAQAEDYLEALQDQRDNHPAARR